MPEDLRQLESSEVAKEAVKILGKAVEHHVPSRNKFTTVRDYLLVTTLIENGSRPGPLENAKMKRFRQAIHTENGRWTILVDEHKTTRHHGPAELTVDDRLYGYLKIYVDYIRPAFVDSAKEEALFIKDDGKQFNKGTIGRRVSALFQRAGIRKDIRVSATNIRKMHSDEAAEMSPTKKRAINTHMKHMPRTADRHYVLKVNAKRAARAHELMTSYLRNNEQSSKSEEKETKSSSESEKSEVEQHGHKQIENHEDEDKEKSVDEQSFSGLTNEDKSVLMTVFESSVELGRILTIAEFRNRMRTDLFLRKYLPNAEKTKKMQDFIRHKTEVVRRTALPDIPVDEFDFVTTVSSKQRRPWSDHDAQCIENKFSTFDKMPSKNTTVGIFNGDPILQHILQREGRTRCYEKVKSFFKKKAL